MTDTVSTSRRPRVLFCVDSPMWAHDFKTTNLMKNLSPRIDIRKVFEKDLTAEDIEWADAVIVYYWMQMLNLRRFIPLMAPKVTMCGISCPTDMEGQTRATGINILKVFDAVFVHNKMLYDEFKDMFGKPVYLNQNGVDTSFYTPVATRPPGKPLIVGWAGSLVNHGNKRGYHDVLAPAVEMTPGVLLRTAAREDKWRGPNEMLEFYRGLDAYIVTSRVEGTPNPALEAAACGVPVISSRVGNMPELIRNGENGFLVDRTPQAFSAAMATLRDDTALLEKMRVQIRQDILEWDWSKRAQLYGRMITETIERKSKLPVA